MTTVLAAPTSNVALNHGDTFPVKLMKLLHSAEQNGQNDVISWLPDGKTFKVHDKTRFASEIMPHYFASSTYKSFQRSKNLWGFHTVSKGAHKGECSHPLFVRGNLDLCRKMVRVRTKSDETLDDLAEVSVPSDIAGITAPSGAGQQPNQQQPSGANLMHQALLGNLSSLNPSLFLAAQQRQLQQQQFASVNSLGGQSNSGLGSDSLLSALALLGNNNGNANLIAALQQNPTPTPAPLQSIQTLQQLLQLALPAQQQQAAPSVLDQQIMALLSLQQQQNQHGQHQLHQQSSPAAMGDLSMLSMNAYKSPPVSSVAAPFPASTPPISAIDTSSTGEAKSKSKNDGKLNSNSNKSKSNNRELSAQQHKTNRLRESALARGSKVVACKARGMEMDHNMHTAFFEIPRDPEHGMDLVCSFPPCRNGGIKFLYCKYCDDVIAKRTFRTHHGHEDLVEAETLRQEEANKRPIILRDNIPPKKRHKRNGLHEEEQEEEGRVEIDPVDVAANNNVHEITNESSDTSSSSGNADNDAIEKDATSESMVEVRAEWDALLDERQDMDSKDDISGWLDKVVDISERFKRAFGKSKKLSKAVKKED